LPDLEAPRPDRVAMLASREQDDLVPGARQRCSEVAADSPGSDDRDSHGRRAARSRTYLQAGQVWNSATTSSDPLSAARSTFSAWKFIDPPHRGQRKRCEGGVFPSLSSLMSLAPGQCFRVRSEAPSPSISIPART